MDSSNYISSDLKVLSLTDTIGKAKVLFETSTCSHLPILKNKELIGLISENDIHGFGINKSILANNLDIIQNFSTLNSNNLIELIKLFAINHSNILPVVDENQFYLGCYELNDILQLFLDTPFLSGSGHTIIVEKNTSDYTFSEISQIIETNNAKLLGAFIIKRDAEMVQILLKINNHDINNTLQSFRRYNYQVISGNLEDQYLEQLKERSEYLQKYLNI